jgi:hypothetical protein
MRRDLLLALLALLAIGCGARLAYDPEAPPRGVLAGTVAERSQLLPMGIVWAQSVVDATPWPRPDGGIDDPYGAEKALGPPDHWSATLIHYDAFFETDHLAYTPKRENGRLVVDFGRPIEARSLVVVETQAVGPLRRVDAIDEDGGHFVLWAGELPADAESRGLATRFTLPQPKTIRWVSLIFEGAPVGEYAIDAVGLEPVRPETLLAELEVNAAPTPLPSKVAWSSTLFHLALTDTYAAGEPGRRLGRVEGFPGGEAWRFREHLDHGQVDLVAAYPGGVLTSEIVIVERSHPGAIRRVEDHSGSSPTLLWEGTYPVDAPEQWLSFRLPQPRIIRELRVVLDTSAVRGEHHIDGVGLVSPASSPTALSRHVAQLVAAPAPCHTDTVWASELFESSPLPSELTGLLGPPSVYPGHGEDAGWERQWQSDGPQAVVVVGFPGLVLAERVVVLETLGPGAIARIEAFAPEGPELLWQGRYAAVAPSQRFELTLDPPRRIQALRLLVDPGRVEGPMALDAIGLEPVGATSDRTRRLARVEVVESPAPWPAGTVWASRVESASHWKGLDELEPPSADVVAALARWSAKPPPRSPWKALGAPDVYPATGEPSTWVVEGSGEQHLTVSFPPGVWAESLVVVDPNGPSRLVRVEDLTGPSAQVVWQGGLAIGRGHQIRLALPAPGRIERLRLVVDPRGGTASIDAVGLVPAATVEVLR